jgi:mono/diheme cytochrome c family protein
MTPNARPFARYKSAHVHRLAATAALAALPFAASAQDAANGADLAEKWCNSCHHTGENDERMFDAGPQFATLADKDTEYLLNAIVRPHDFMPEFPRLSYADMQDLAAFIQSVD